MPAPAPIVEAPDPAPVEQPAGAYYANCDAVRAAGAAPILAGQPGYSRKLDRDGDGVGCENRGRARAGRENGGSRDRRGGLGVWRQAFTVDRHRRVANRSVPARAASPRAAAADRARMSSSGTVTSEPSATTSCPSTYTCRTSSPRWL